MTYAVSEKILNETTKCEQEFSCIECGQCGDRPMCEVEYRDGLDILFLKDKSPLACAYMVPFAGSQICRCPERYAIHINYGK